MRSKQELSCSRHIVKTDLSKDTNLVRLSIYIVSRSSRAVNTNPRVGSIMKFLILPKFHRVWVVTQFKKLNGSI